MKRMLRMAAVGCGLLLAVGAWADTHTWTGTADTDWHNGQNWDSGVVPGANDEAVIASGQVVLATPSDALDAFTLSGGTLMFTNWTTVLTASSVSLLGGKVITPPAINNSDLTNRVHFVCDAFYLAAEYLLATRPRARHFWVLQGHEELSTVTERTQGFADVLAARTGIDFATAAQTEDTACCHDSVAALMRQGRPDGIFMTSEQIIVPLLKTFAALGIARDGIALCCFDNFHSLASLYGIAHIEQPLVEVGMEIARYLQMQHGGHDEPVRKLKLIPRLVPPEQH